MGQEMGENNCSVVAYPPVKFAIKKEFDEPGELEARQLFKVSMVYISQIYQLIFNSRRKNKKEKMKEKFQQTRTER